MCVALSPVKGIKEFLSKKRIAAGAAIDSLDQIVGEGAAKLGPEQGRELGTAEAIDVESLDPLAPLEFGQNGTKRMAAVEIVGAVSQYQ